MKAITNLSEKFSIYLRLFLANLIQNWSYCSFKVFVGVFAVNSL